MTVETFHAEVTGREATRAKGSARVGHLFVVLWSLGLFASQKSERLALARRQTGAKSTNRAKVLVRENYSGPGATEHIEHSVWAHHANVDAMLGTLSSLAELLA